MHIFLLGFRGLLLNYPGMSSLVPLQIEFEQYPTGPHIASRMLYTAENSFGDVSDKVVADFGCGCGTLGLAAALLGAEHVVGFDIDADSLEIARDNADELEVDMEFVQCDIRNLSWNGQIINTIVMNPPFGTRRKGADMDFLSVALKVVMECHNCLTMFIWFSLSPEFIFVSGCV
ncbi:OLC1v1037388C1 [Oldenlandia corymbosa var. corymbosa]|uniref:Methyltransferase-like protein 5 n=1 Tax=Oldenlandia corymbosa var. corymbosa TaxID=529605 RepID=A0AAV1CXN6_OLDCO|nr:OLC1v1037388C1 [Oldenlandia corymbosa var. corymbosa]